MYIVAFNNRHDEKSPYYNWQEKYDWAKKQSYLTLLLWGIVILKEIAPIVFQNFIGNLSNVQLDIQKTIAFLMITATLLLSLRMEIRLQRFRKNIHDSWTSY
jgi:hypothetical protein